MIHVQEHHQTNLVLRFKKVLGFEKSKFERVKRVSLDGLRAGAEREDGRDT